MIIDPLDGSTNFAHGFPHFCVSIAYERRFTSTPSRKPGRSPYTCRSKPGSEDRVAPRGSLC
jgi:hypothetical protein